MSPASSQPQPAEQQEPSIQLALPALTWHGDWHQGHVQLGGSSYHSCDDFLLAPPLRSCWSRVGFAAALALRQQPRDDEAAIIDLLALLSEHYGPAAQAGLERLQDCWDHHCWGLDPDAMAARLVLEARRMVDHEAALLHCVVTHLTIDPHLAGGKQWSRLPPQVTGPTHADQPRLGWDGEAEMLDQVVLRLWCHDEREPLIGRIVDERGWHTITQPDHWRRWLQADPPAASLL